MLTKNRKFSVIRHQKVNTLLHFDKICPLVYANVLVSKLLQIIIQKKILKIHETDVVKYMYSAKHLKNKT